MNKFMVSRIPAILLMALITLGCNTACSSPNSRNSSWTREPLAASAQISSSDVSSEIHNEQTVRIRFACPRQHQAEFERLAADFHEQNPSIHVKVIVIEDIVAGDRKNLARGIASGADTAYYLVDFDAALQGAWRDLSAFLEADKSFAPEDFFPGMLEAFRWHRGTWALPSQTWVFVLYHDKSMFDAAGVAYPALSWTRDDFLSAAQQLTQRAGNEVRQYGFVDNSGYVREVTVHALATQSQTEQTPLDTPALVDAVRWYTDLALRFRVMPEALENQEAFDRQRDLISNGQVAMWEEMLLPSLGLYSPSSSHAKRNMGVALFPVRDGLMAYGFMYGYMMSAGTEHPQESWRWLRFLSRQRLLGPHNVMASWLPARRSVVEQSNYWDQFDEEIVDVARYAAEHLYITAGGSEKKRQLDQAIDAVFEGTSVEEALTAAQAAWEQHLAQVAKTTPVPVVVAPPSQQSAADVPTIGFAPPGGTDVAVYRGLAADFNQNHTDMQVQITSPGQADNADCFADLRSVRDGATRAELLNLQPLLETDTAFDLGDFSPRFLDTFRYQGDLWGIPFQAQAQVMFYNQKLFDEVSMPYPQPGWTLDDFLATAVALTQGSGDKQQYGFLPLNGDASDLTLFLALQGAYPWDEQEQPRFDAPEVVAAVRWYTDLAMKYGVSPVFPNDLPGRDPAAQDTRFALVQEGKAATWTDFTGVDRRDVWPSDAEIGMAPLPIGEVPITQFLPQGSFIAADTPYPEVCWAWIKFLSEQPSVVQSLPGRRSVLESPAFAARVEADVLSTYRALTEYDDLPVAPSSEAGDQLTYLYQAVADILNGARPEAALAKAQGQATGK